ncbi:hypothetical protein CCUS01_08771 [Colletotrichum cuscutae]|uniref:Uncharacterized protein n=1 Tax=Colletotrichum cuscutae TaxID=1209917 RepID=A0AAI9XRT4_9PEZI|nr:hypothetical protein CCUS01_08771 [Colletotrichum cuscutae]
MRTFGKTLGALPLWRGASLSRRAQPQYLTLPRDGSREPAIPGLARRRWGLVETPLDRDWPERGSPAQCVPAQCPWNLAGSQPLKSAPVQSSRCGSSHPLLPTLPYVYLPPQRVSPPVSPVALPCLAWATSRIVQPRAPSSISIHHLFVSSISQLHKTLALPLQNRPHPPLFTLRHALFPCSDPTRVSTRESSIDNLPIVPLEHPRQPQNIAPRYVVPSPHPPVPPLSSSHPSPQSPSTDSQQPTVTDLRRPLHEAAIRPSFCID